LSQSDIHHQVELITGFAGSVLSTAVPVTDCIGAAAAAPEAST